MIDEEIADAYERRIRGTYRNAAPRGPGLCDVCSAPTSKPEYRLCYTCEGQASSGVKLASGGVIPLSWARMDAQSYLDLRQYKESTAATEQIDRLRILLWLAFTKHADCIIPDRTTRPFALTHVPSTSGLRTDSHPLEVQIMSLLAPDRPRATPAYIGPVGGQRNDRRVLRPDHWAIDAQALNGAERVLIIDDTWVTGSHAQSVAAAFEAAGINARIVVLGRALDPRRTDHGNYLTAHPAAPFASDICPVTGMRHG